jgi:hypothetical protein
MNSGAAGLLGGSASRHLAALGAVLASLGLVASAQAFTARGSMDQAYVTGATPGQKLTLIDKQGKKVDSKKVSELGGVVFRKVEPGGGYTIKGGSETSKRFKVLTTRPKPQDPSIYDQSIPSSGYGYLTTRDGTQLAINVYPPTVPGPGPYPTLVEYSGYGYAKPGGGESSIQQIVGALGFAVVDVNMRGTGCSGGSFDFFEPAQGLDGYDVIETVARQPWVLNHKPGMMGISYGGISQLFVARNRPPSLAAIAPLSLLDQTQTTLYPGGILNTGFALNWAEERVHDAEPAGPDGGQSWAYEQIQNGDTICKDNQQLHPEAVDLLAKVKRNSTYKPKVADPLAPLTFVHKINVPTFVACQWTDEQTGGHCPTLAGAFTGTDRKWFTFTNGTHIDSLDPETFNKWYDFLELYVAQRKPSPDPVQVVGAPVVYQVAMGISGVTLPPDPIQLEPDYASALAAFEALPPIRILFDNGAGGQPGHPYPGFEQSFSRFPAPHTKGRSFYLADDGKMSGKPPKQGAADSFKLNQAARPPTDFTGDTAAGTDGLWTATPPYNWTQNPAGTAASYLTAPLKSNTTVLGAGALQAWVRSSKPDVDLQVTVSEVRPDGKETFVQGGWLKAAARKLDRDKSTKLEPVLSLRKSDLAPMPHGEFAKLTIPLYYQGHAYRAGSQIRITVSAVDGDQPIWAFADAVGKGAKIEVAHSPEMPSRLLLPVVGGVDVPTGLPPCPGLRGEPCRDYLAYANKTAALR